MTRRTREWMKLGGLVGAALVLALAFAGAVSVPREVRNSAQAQQALSPGLTWLGWPVPLWLSLGIVAAMGLGMMTVAIVTFSKTE